MSSCGECRHWDVGFLGNVCKVKGQETKSTESCEEFIPLKPAEVSVAVTPVAGADEEETQLDWMINELDRMIRECDDDDA